MTMTSSTVPMNPITMFASFVGWAGLSPDQPFPNRAVRGGRRAATLVGVMSGEMPTRCVVGDALLILDVISVFDAERVGGIFVDR